MANINIVGIDLASGNLRPVTNTDSATSSDGTALFISTGIPEVTVPDFSSFTWVNQGASTRGQVTTGGVTYEALQGAAAADVNLRLLVTTMPATPWTMETTCSSIEPLVTTGNWRFGLCARDSASGRIVVLGGATTGWTLFTSKFTTATAFSANYTSALFNETVNRYPYRLRWTDDGTDWRWYYSPDGLQWIQFDIARSRTDFTAAPDQVGVVFNSLPSVTVNNFAVTHFSLV